jgi:hypothetical protein
MCCGKLRFCILRCFRSQQPEHNVIGHINIDNEVMVGCSGPCKSLATLVLTATTASRSVHNGVSDGQYTILADG